MDPVSVDRCSGTVHSIGNCASSDNRGRLRPVAYTTVVDHRGMVGAFIFQSGPFGPFSFLPHVAAGYAAGLLDRRRRGICGLLHWLLLLALAFYPTVGPAWLWPHFLWVHAGAALLMFSPVQPKMDSFLHQSESALKLAAGLGTTLFLATLFGHAVGTIMFEMVYWPTLISEKGAWKANWQLLTWLYPVERALVALFGTLAGTGLLKASRIYGFKMGVNLEGRCADAFEGDYH